MTTVNDRQNGFWGGGLFGRGGGLFGSGGLIRECGHIRSFTYIPVSRAPGSEKETIWLGKNFI